MNFDKLKYIREKYELTQMEMANILNVSRSAYSLWEINKNTIPLIKLNEYCNHFELSLDYVVGLSNTRKKKLDYISLDRNEIGMRIKQTRKELKLTQDKLAKTLNTTHSAISAYENGITLIPTLFLIEFARISNISLDWFCGKTTNKKIK